MACKNLHTWPKSHPGWDLLWGSIMKHINPFQNLHSTLWLSCIFLVTGNMGSSQSNMFSHFSFHFRNLWYKLSFTVQLIFGPSICGINMGCTKDYGWLVDGGKHCGLCTSISWSELEDSCELMEFSWETLVLTTWAEFLVNLCIWILVLRPLLSRYNSNKDCTYFTNYVQALILQNPNYTVYNSKIWLKSDIFPPWLWIHSSEATYE